MSVGSDHAGTSRPEDQAGRDPYVRPGHPGDAEEIARLIVRENTRPADATAIERYLTESPSVVAVAGGQIVGAIYCRPFSPDILEWRNSLVAASHRRLGLGRRMVELLERESRDAGYRALIGVNCWKRQGATQERASAARSFWRAMGWSIVFATDGSVVLARHL